MLRRIVAVMLAVCCLVILPIGVLPVSAEGYYYNRKGDSVPTPDAYIPEKTLDGISLGIGAFSGIQDLFVSEDGTLYIADSGNDRIVVIASDDTVIRVIETITDGETTVVLNDPQGVFYRDRRLYICNTGSQEILVVGEDGTLIRRCGRPDSESLPKNTEFKPSKVAVNSAGSMFVQATGVYQGLLQYGPEGEFINFFGATKVEVTPAVVLQNMWKNLFSDEQREGLVRVISSELSNVFIDNEDFVFTVTASVSTKQVRRLNAAGENILKYPGYDDTSLFTSGYDRDNFGDQETDYSKGKLIVSQICDIHTDDDGILSVLDQARGKILQYDTELNPLCIFGGSGEQIGYFRQPTSLEKRGNTYLIADAEKNTITCMKPTSYILRIREALTLYKEGEYAEAVEGWQEILNVNPSFTIAYRSIGRALLQEGKSGEALEYLREGDDRYYYSLAMQEYRRQFIRENWIWLIPTVIVLIVVFYVGCRRLKQWLLTRKKGGKRHA